MAACINHVVVLGSRRSLYSLIQNRAELRHFHQLRSIHRNITIKKQKCVLLQKDFTKCVSLYSLVTVRNNSDGPKISSQDVSNYIPEPPAIPLSDVPMPEVPIPVETLQTLNSLNEVSLSSVGLGGWSPPGMVQQMLEAVHCTFDLPWCYTIVVCTVALRILMFPVVILSQRNVAKLHNHMPTMTKLQQRFTDARSSGDPVEVARAGHELMSFMQRNDIKPIRNMFVPMAQMPVFLSVFFGLRQMSTLPLESLTSGGIFWFTDLSIPDPTYLLPLLTASTLALTIELGVDGMKAQSMGHNAKWVFRALPIIVFPFISNFPCAMLCYWFTSNAFSLVQVGFLKIPNVRKYFNIEMMVKHPESAIKKKKFIDGFKDSYKNAKMAGEVADRQRIDDLKFKEAGQGPIQKTYLYDPTKAKKKPVVSAKPRS